MATTERDYYDILGISRNATEAEIKKAFRAKARELHPDVSDAPDAEERFREAAEAYEVLSKSETRQLYDRFGHAGLRSGGFQPGSFDFGTLSDLFSAFFGDDIFGTAARGGSARGADVAAQVEIELVEAATGVTREVPFQIAVACGRCSGDGVEPGTTVSTCPVCGGSGRIQQVSRSLFGEFIRAQPCTRCEGTGSIVDHPCEQCGGGGRVLEERSIPIDIPAGIHDGQRIRLSGQGHAGVLGGRSGDVYVLVRVRPDERFVREGDDIFSTVDLTMTQAALGTALTIPTLDGETELELAPGTQPGHVQVLRGKGMPVLNGRSRGNHQVLVNVHVPQHLTSEQRVLLEQLDADLTHESYTQDEGFFHKLRQHFR
jgi:molecular chaperone DnaJ